MYKLNVFIEAAEKVHNKKYKYNKVELKGIHDKVEVICKKHGSFWITPNAHINYAIGCPTCALEQRVKDKKKKVISYYKRHF